MLFPGADATLTELPYLIAMRRPGLFGYENIEGFSQHLIRRVTEDLLGSAIEECDPLILVRAYDRLRGDRENRGVDGSRAFGLLACA